MTVVVGVGAGAAVYCSHLTIKALKNYAQKRRVLQTQKQKHKKQNKRNKSRGKSPMLSGRHLADEDDDVGEEPQN